MSKADNKKRIEEQFAAGGFVYWSRPAETSFGRREKINQTNGTPGSPDFAVTLEKAGRLYPFYSGEWWVLPESEWVRVTADTKNPAECKALSENLFIVPTEIRRTLDLINQDEPPRFRLLKAKPGRNEPLLGFMFDFVAIIDVRRNDDDEPINLKVRVRNPLEHEEAYRDLILYDTTGTWLMPDFVEERIRREDIKEVTRIEPKELNALTEYRNGQMKGNEMNTNAVKQGTTTDVNRSAATKIDIGTLTIPAAIEILQRQLKYEEETVEILEPVEGSPWDAAHALALVFKRMFGWASAEPTMGFFGPEPPALIAVEVGVGKTINVPWGTFKVPGIDGKISASTTKKNGRIIFQLQAVVRRKHEQAVKDIAAGIREVLKTESIYRGKSLKMVFPSDGPSRGTGLPMPTFLDVSGAVEGRLVFSDDVEKAVRTNLFTPIEKYDSLKALKIPFKRGVLLAGKYGTGKTEIAFTVGKSATDRGITFCYCEQAKDLPEMLRFAAQYTPAVVFCEDVDRVTSGERDEDLDEILNVIDGIESKASEILVVLTTNNVEKIHPGMIRPGRLDAVIEVKRPDGPAVERLLALYARGKMAPEQDLTGIGVVLEGQTPAIIREVVERSKLAALKDCQPGDPILLTAKALEESAKTMRMQIDLLERGETVTLSKDEALGKALVSAVTDAHKRAEDDGSDEE